MYSKHHSTFSVCCRVKAEFKYGKIENLSEGLFTYATIKFLAFTLVVINLSVIYLQIYILFYYLEWIELGMKRCVGELE